AKQHLINRLKPNPQGFIALDNFMKLPVAEEYQLRKNSTTEGEWKLVPFFDWFFKLAEIVNKYLYSMWYDGMISVDKKVEDTSETSYPIDAELL
ncbi:hypothetical protein ANCDUO_24622, partial [Ancylostoma duodenale]